MRQSDLLTTKQLADRYGVTRETVCSWVRCGRIPCIRPSRRVIRFCLAAVESALARAGRKVVRR